ncbi:TonB-dependent receptor domain-containing protein [Methylophilus sp. Leaf408]|uniref:TonB-dependent receptor domain-containing protein n=1 Tax=Methylophilus sp. Leaf408 TaxID=2876561 RepID=UPI001E51021F|nr:TonB-dependent receptor [Methylophilus sp. Leaf408]
MQIKKIEQCAMYTLFVLWGVISVQLACAEALNTQLPKQQEETFSVPVNIDIPQQPLANSLHALGKATGMSISFPNDIVSGKTAPEVRGRMTRQEALRRVLNDTGLAPKIEGDSVYIQKAQKKEEKTVELDKVEVRAKRFYEVGPLPGLGLTKEEIPGNVQSISAKEIKEAHSLSLTDLMNKKLQSVTVNDYQGNPFQMDVQYRGFTAGPQIGTPQGLSVFFDGIRVNEPFGDVVNWDMIPMNALAGVDVFPGSNPIFGLNTLGGAFTLKTKDGFNHAGSDVEVLNGSFGRKQLQAEGGWNNGTVGIFAAANIFLEDGWRENSPSRVNQLFTKGTYRGDKLDLNLSALLVKTDLVGNGLIPSEEYERNRNGVFTSPDTTKNTLDQYQLSGSYFVNDIFTITGQVYRRHSNRKQRAADAYTQYDGNDVNSVVRSKIGNTLEDGEQYSCLYNSTGRAAQYGLPNYHVYSIPHGSLFSGTDPLFDQFIQGNVNQPPSFFGANSFNAEITDQNFLKYAQYYLQYAKNPTAATAYSGQYNSIPVPPTPDPLPDGTAPYSFAQNTFPTNAMNYNTLPTEVDIGGIANFNYYTTLDSNGNPITDNYILFLGPINGTNCATTQAKYGNNTNFAFAGSPPVRIDGAANGTPGVVEGIPTAQITNTEIDQIVDGASLQLNWNLEKHKFMIGTSIDDAKADYSSSGRLGMFDSNRNAFLAPELLLEQFVAARQDIRNNNFEGTSTTKSIYASETWSPVDTIHITGALRYNETTVKNTIATTAAGDRQRALSEIIALADLFNICIDGICPSTGLRTPDLANLLNPPETEKFTYRSLNPAFGATWQAKENLNLYSNWSQGTRTPSVIELGCAIDKTLIDDGRGGTAFKSIVENRSCNLPSTLSGDPHLPQIKATTYEVGARGFLQNIFGADRIEWNLSAYRTDLKDDIYLITLPQNQSLFDSIGNTRRQGIEAGLAGEYGKARFKLNYALTDATFQNTFEIASPDNSSSVSNDVFGTGDGSRSITVRPGNRMPGVPLHNINANFSYDLTPDWQVGFSAVMHSESFLRGNENNEHRPGVTTFRSYDVIDPVTNVSTRVTVPRQPTGNPGKVPGYTVFNFQTSYKLSKEWTASLLINNIFDREYFSAGRLGRNPFSPSILGAIGPDGYNHNSNDWLSTNFIAPGAPRGIWFSLNWHFVPD